MKHLLAFSLGLVLAANGLALDSTARITPVIRAELDTQKQMLVRWAADPTLVAAVRVQNAHGPLPGLTNRKWKGLPANDPVVAQFEKNAAGRWLAKKVAGTSGMIREAFLCGAQGEKVAFVEKPSNYLHAGEEKFQVPMSGRVWEGVPEFDASSRSHAVQIAVPVLDRGKPIGVLVAGVSMRSMKSAR